MDSIFAYRIGFLGEPASSIPFQYISPVEWNIDNIARLKTLGFNTIQINVAWGPRPGD